MSDSLSLILQYVKEHRKIDFGIYRPDTIERRLGQRLAATGARDYATYLDRLKSTPPELDQLISTLTITTSHFFRNPLVFEVLAEFILPELFETFRHEPLRIWCAGCGRGEEAYSLAIIIRNLLKGSDASALPAAIIATDIDGAALGAADEGRYSDDVLREVKKGDLDRHFTRDKGSYRVSEPIRRMVTFAHHDVTTCRPPQEGIFSDYHLIFCRNVLIYLNRDMQDRVIRFFSGILLRRDCLVLGEAEMIPSGEFSEAFPGTKIFRKGGRAT